MTKLRTIILSAALTLTLPAMPAFAADGWGSSWSFGPTTSRIIHAKTTLIPGRLAVVTANTGPLFLWPGMSNPTSDLIQTTMDAWPDNAAYCKATAGQLTSSASPRSRSSPLTSSANPRSSRRPRHQRHPNDRQPQQRRLHHSSCNR
jgi:hypothetical protein